ncbi:DUF4174 domain-containing protein [Thalassococcus sp. CAU 1522]|uniref:DUF4174 domain-containing protein n=1 Tax=Thalassococcus arenae TaxID=2851652 RepID=A0ABS6N8Z8_9RHOB|nr:DUF4174 domain-containing protein [Thalassococcus arenae]MBV2360481.1 DUF4174 domain-containing protein [Thalassococcus arenae]
MWNPIALTLLALAPLLPTQLAAQDTVAAAGAAPLETAEEIAETAPSPDDPAETMIRPAGDVTLAEYQWIKRPVIVFADSPADPRFVQQMQFISDRLDALAERDVVVITDTDPASRSEVRQKLRPRGFMLVVMAKDGTIVIRKPAPWDVREISRSIDKLPLRQQEIRDRRATGDTLQ